MTTRKTTPTPVFSGPEVRMLVALSAAIVCILGAIASLLLTSPASPWFWILISVAFISWIVTCLYIYKLRMAEIKWF